MAFDASNLHWLVLDEADRLLDQGFEQKIGVLFPFRFQPETSLHCEFINVLKLSDSLDVDAVHVRMTCFRTTASRHTIDAFL